MKKKRQFLSRSAMIGVFVLAMIVADGIPRSFYARTGQQTAGGENAVETDDMSAPEDALTAQLTITPELTAVPVMSPTPAPAATSAAEQASEPGEETEQGEETAPVQEPSSTPTPTATPTLTPTPSPSPTPTPSPTPAFTFAYTVSNVTDYVNVRAEASAQSTLVGKLHHNAYAKIHERGDEWTRLTSGKVTGYVKNDYLLFDEEAVQALQKAKAILVEITAGTVNVRTAPTTESEILREAKKGEQFVAEPQYDVPEWKAIRYDGQIAYLSARFVTEKITFATAQSKEEEEEAKRAAELAKALEEAKKYTPEKTTRQAVELTDEELFLLSVVVEMESGGESFEGKLAVANVVINRLLDGYWGDTLHAVVYAPGQFSGANSGRIEKFSSKVSSESKKAAVAAAAGENNIGTYMFFIMNNKAKYSTYSRYYILGCHCFYAR